MSQQFLRRANLVVVKDTIGIDLSDLRFKFQIIQNDTPTPNTAIIRVYNLSPETERKIIREYDTVVLQAGYQTGNFGIIFNGTIKQFHRGKENNVDSYIDILGADGDVAYNFGVVNASLPAQNTAPDRAKAAADAMGLPISATSDMTGGILPRGKTMFGMARLHLQNFTRSNNSRWSIQNGVITIIKDTDVLNDQAIVLNSSTGMIGVPESTDNGIRVQMLLNPLVKIGTPIQIDQRLITQTIIRDQFFPGFTPTPTFVADVTKEGFYRVIVSEHVGDTRGHDWYTNVVCLRINVPGTTVNTVEAFG